MVKYLSVICSCLLIGLISCKKEGCTDANATNFSEKAKKDDGSCYYEGNLVFWYNSTTQTIMNLYNISSLTYVIDSVNIGSFLIEDVWETAPPCGVDTSIGRTFYFSTNETHNVNYYVMDQNSEVRFSGNVLVGIGDCTSLELMW